MFLTFNYTLRSSLDKVKLCKIFQIIQYLFRKFLENKWQSQAEVQESFCQRKFLDDLLSFFKEYSFLKQIYSKMFNERFTCIYAWERTLVPLAYSFINFLNVLLNWTTLIDTRIVFELSINISKQRHIIHFNE